MDNTSLLYLVKRDFKRERKRFIGALWSIFIATSLLFLLLSLGLGIRSYVIEKILSRLPSNQIIVRSKPLDLMGVSFSSSKSSGLNNNKVKEYESWKEIKKVYKQADAAFPVHVYGKLIKSYYGSDAIIVGYDSEYLASGQDWEDKFKYEPGKPVPVVASSTLLEIYNEAFASANNLPRLTEKDIIGRELFLDLGKNSLRRAEDYSPLNVKGVIIGFSNISTIFGASVPLEYVLKWNKMFGMKDNNYSALILEVTKPEYVDEVVSRIKDTGYRVESNLELSRRLTTLTRVMIGILLILGLLFLFLSLINLVNIFRLIVNERKREVALFRSLGASIKDIISLFVLESALLGLAGSIAGILSGLVFSLIAQKYLLAALPSFPFKPLYLFTFSPLAALLIIAGTIVLCVISPFSIFVKSASSDPAKHLG
ncbi:MAG: FtsX-like permease family protein [Candidatus Coatesbacteria bacterium]|nr:FtsX-like permease family protein [Candidatus Coatesbacteria bacterium]